MQDDWDHGKSDAAQEWQKSWCKTCKSKHNNNHIIVDYRWSKSRHDEAALNYTMIGGFIAAVGMSHSFIRALDTWWLPTRLRNSGKINDPNFVLTTLWSERRANTVSAVTFSTAAIFFIAALYRRKQYEDCKTKLKKLMKTSCSNA